jgi:predicted O-linked N-acetylglucosamine transferase (SPINDLY family)
VSLVGRLPKTNICMAPPAGGPVSALPALAIAFFRAWGAVAHNAGMQDWIAADADAYVAMAVARAADLPGLSALRAQIRDRLRSLPMFDAPAFAQDLEQAL